MTHARLLTTLLLSGLLLAGCADDKPSAVDDTVQTQDPVQQLLGGDVVSGADNSSTGLDTPFLMSVAAGPDSPLTSFRWRIPEGAIVRYQPIPEFADFIIEQLVFEMVPIYPNNGTGPEEYAILVFRLDDEAQLASTIIGVPVTGSTTNLATATPFTVAPQLAGRYLFISAGSLEEGDEIGVVVAAKSTQSSPFGLLLAPRTSRPSDGQAAPETAEELLDGRTALSLEVAGSGKGFQFSRYSAFRLQLPPALYFTESRSGAVSVQDQLPREAVSAASARVVTLGASFDSDGFSRASGSYSSFGLFAPACPSVGTYDFQSDLHGTAVGHRSVLSETPYGAADLVAGWPFFSAIGEGSGSAESSMVLDYANACTLESLFFTQLDLGATVADLLGVPAAVGGNSGVGLAGSIPPAVRGDTLVSYDGDVYTELDGWGAQYQAFLDAMAAS